MKKPKTILLIGTAVSIAALSLASTGQAATYNWNTTNGTWDTSSANWTGAGSIWVDSSDAVFNNTATASTITLGETINATSVILGSATAADNNANYTLAGGALNDSGTLVVQGNSTNSGAYASSPTVTINSTVAVTGATLIGRANFRITGGTYTTDRITANPTSPDWANVTIAGGSVTATNGIDGSYGGNGTNGTTATFQLNLNGGTLYTPSIKVADRETGTNNNAWLTFNGTTVKATASTATFITLYGGSQNAYVSNGGAILDTNGNNITIGVNLKNTSGQNGTLTKQGAGTLTLSGSNTFTGDTKIDGGTVLAANASLQNSAFDTSGAAGTGGLTFSGTTPTLGGLKGSTDWTVPTGVTSLTLNVGTGVSTSYSGNLSAGTAGMNLVKSGAGSQTLSGANTYNGSITVSGGKLVVSNNNSPAALAIGNTASTSGAFYLTGGTVARSSGQADTFAQNGYGYINISGGTLSGISIWQGGSTSGNRTSGVGVIVQSAGAVNLNNGQPFVLGGVNLQGGRGVLNLDGGTLSVAGAMSAGWDTNTAGRGEFNINGGTATASEFSFKGTTTGVLNLRGGTLAVSTIRTYTGNNNPNSTGYVNFNGGTLQATQEGAALIALATTNTQNNVFVYSGGAMIDTNSKNVTIGNALNAPTGDGLSSVVLATAGAGYIGEPAVVITGGGGSGATARATIDSVTGVVTGIVITNPGTGYTSSPNATLSGGGATTAATLGVVATAANSSGGLTKTGAGNLTLTGNNTYTGATLVTAGTLVVSGSGSINSSASVTVSTGATLTNDAAALTTALGLGEGAALSGSSSFAPSALTITGDLAGGIFTTITLDSSFTKTGALAFTLTNVVDGTYSLFSGTTPGGFFTSVSVGGTPLIDQTGGIFSAEVDGFSYTYDDNLSSLGITAVPEPATWAIVGVGLAFLLYRRRVLRLVCGRRHNA